MNGLWAFQRGQMWTADLAQDLPAPVDPRVPADFSEVGEAELEGALEGSGAPSFEILRSRFGEGKRCFGARVRGRLAAYGWVSAGAERIGEMERVFRIPPGEVYVWDCVTLPAYRRNRLYSALLGHMVERLRSEGVQRVWIGSDLENHPSIRGFRVAGFQPAAELTHVRVLVFRGLRAKPLDASTPGLAEMLLPALRAEGERKLGNGLFGIN